MKKILFFAVSLLFCGCQSKLDKTVNRMYDLAEEYIEALDNAKSKEEIRDLKLGFESKRDIIEEELEKIDESGDYSLKEMQDIIQSGKFEDLKERVKEAEHNANSRYE